MSANQAPSSVPTSLYNPVDPLQREQPYPTYARMRDEQPISYSPLFRSWIVTRYEEVQQVLKDPARFSSASNFLQPRVALPPEASAVLGDSMARTTGIVNSDGAQHTRIRNYVSREFTPQRIAALEPQLRALIDELIDRFVADGQADLIQQFAVPFAAAVIADLLGTSRADIATFKRGADHWLTLLTGLGTAEQLLAAAHGFLLPAAAMRGYQHLYLEWDRPGQP